MRLTGEYGVDTYFSNTIVSAVLGLLMVTFGFTGFAYLFKNNKNIDLNAYEMMIAETTIPQQ